MITQTFVFWHQKQQVSFVKQMPEPAAWKQWRCEAEVISWCLMIRLIWSQRGVDREQYSLWLNAWWLTSVFSSFTTGHLLTVKLNKRCLTFDIRRGEFLRALLLDHFTLVFFEVLKNKKKVDVYESYPMVHLDYSLIKSAFIQRPQSAGKQVFRKVSAAHCSTGCCQQGSREAGWK